MILKLWGWSPTCLFQYLAVHLLLTSVLSAQDPTLLQVRVLEGDRAVYPVGSRATRGITIQVTDELGRPAESATVSFRLPDEGPSGTFSTGSKTEIVTTRADGRASVWGMQWNRTAGSFDVRITAVKGQIRAGTVCPQFLSDSPGASASARIAGHGGHKWLWISLGVAGAAAGGVFASGLTSKKVGSPSASDIPGLAIGTPTIILGRP